MKKIRIAQQKDWQQFLALTVAEGWRVPQVEFNLFQADWLHQARVLEQGDTFCGLVTAVAHQHSGWVGNLIVPQELRGRGCGSLLFEAALAALEGQGLASVWLTASEMGQPLYEKHGFVKVGVIERWVSHVGRAPEEKVASTNCAKDLLRDADRKAWGENRSSLLETMIGQGRAFACDDTVALLQQEAGMQVIGPWYSPSQCPKANRQVLLKILAAADKNVEIVADVLISSPAKLQLSAAGFTCSGRNSLMVKGDTPNIDLSAMVSLASLGSVG